MRCLFCLELVAGFCRFPAFGAWCSRAATAGPTALHENTEHSMASQALEIPVLYHHERWDAYECMGCHDLMETPRTAVLKNGQERVPVKANPENRMLWLELMTANHEKCMAYSGDAEKQEQHKIVRIDAKR